MKLLSKWSFARLGRLVGGIADRAGLTASIESHCQRFACVAANDVVAAEPPPGTPLLVDLFGVVEHSGIYLGHGTVAELYGDDLMREVSLSEFLTGSTNGGRSVRTGAHVFAACDKATGDILWSRVAEDNARAFIRRIRTVKYRLLRNNCHLFSISCISGKFNSGLSIAEGLHLGGMSVGVLTAAIGHFMNYGKEAVWRPVRGWDRKSLGVAEDGESAETDAEVFVSEPARDFNVTLSQVAYYCDRFALTSPIKRGVNEVATGVLADALWQDEGTPAPCGWKIQSGKFGFRLVDHEGSVGFSGKEGEVREKYAEFCDWYETALLPAILNERVS